jgi:hypothetical protein
MSDRQSPRSLERLQLWMQAVIVHPEGVEAGVRSAAARDAIEILPEDLHGVIPASTTLSGAERLGIYASAYFARLMECLRQEFPALRRAVGDKAFNAFAARYLQEHPSQSYTLAELGRRFPPFLAATRPRDAAPRPNWADFVIELATVERTYAEVFDGPGIEQSRVLQPEDLHAIPPDRWPEARLAPAPCVRLLELSHPIHEYITAVRKNQPALVPQPAPTWLVITRRDYVVRRAAISEEEFKLLALLAAGASVGEAIAHGMQNADDVASLARKLENWFRQWTASGYFQAVWLP